MSGYPFDYVHDVNIDDQASLDRYLAEQGCPDLPAELLREVRLRKASEGTRALSRAERQVYERFRLAVSAWYVDCKVVPGAGLSKGDRVAALRASAPKEDALAFSSWPQLGAATEFDALVRQKPWVFVAFVSRGCIASRMMDRALATTRQRFQTTMDCYAASKGRDAQLAERFAVRGLPTFLLFKNGGLKEVKRGGGLGTAEWLDALDDMVPLT
ncbi:thioredoxin family protein [Steroidobacter flavus]|uniref:Thioredoxin family protein n=1 Tax=Steroidobacter flavus TaxID=1842136 RepID=A0ABV8SNE4_9GAMM